MKLFLSLFTILSIFIISCTNTKKERIQIKFKYEIINEDIDKNLFYINWKDTLGLNEGYTPNSINEKTKELWCYITNKQNDTLGYYKGLSTSQTGTFFQSKDSLIILNFKIGPTMFPEKFKNDTTGMKAYFKKNKLPIELKPFEFNLKNNVNKEFEVTLEEK